MRADHLLCIILLGLLFTSCTAAPAVSTVPSVTSPADTTQSPANNSSGNSVSSINTPDFSEVTPVPAETNSFVRLVEEDLAGRLRISSDQIHFLKMSDIDWQDITQGCQSTPGQILKKGAVNGYQIWLEANGKNYLYHIGLDNTIFLCPE